MKYISLAIAAAALLVLSGCTTDTTGDTSTYPTQQPVYENPNSVIPPQETPYGYAYDLSGYLLPTKTLESRSVSKRFFITRQTNSYYFEPTTETLTRYLEGVQDDLQRPIVTVFEGEIPNQIKVEQYRVDTNRIDATFYDANGIVTAIEQYPRYLQTGGDLLRDQNGACVLKEYISGYTMDNIPVQAHPNGYYNSVLHFYCGTVDGSQIDRYYAEGWGQILAIRQDIDGSTTYSVFDQNSYQEF